MLLFFALAYIAWGAFCIAISHIAGVKNGWLTRVLFLISIPYISVDGFRKFNSGGWTQRHSILAKTALICLVAVISAFAVVVTDKGLTTSIAALRR